MISFPAMLTDGNAIKSRYAITRLTASVILGTSGTTCFTSSELNGIGTCGLPIRVTGALSESKQFSPIIAAISETAPAKLESSPQTTA